MATTSCSIDDELENMLWGLDWPVARYAFRFRVQSNIRLPEFAGSSLRGVFGRALRKTACMTKLSKCNECPLYRSCPYTAIFETPAPTAHTLQKFSQIPNPYIFEPPAIGRTIYEPGQELCFDMVLIGQARHHLALIIYALERAMRHGIGPGKGRADLICVEHLDASGIRTLIYQPSFKQVVPHEQTVRLKPSDKSSVTMYFDSPLRLQDNGRTIEAQELTSVRLLMALIRRISLLMELQAFHTLNLPFSKLKEISETIELTQNLAWKDWIRYSSRQQQKLHFGGLVGKIELKNVNSSFNAMIQIGQWIHVGKNATFGLGKYQISHSR